MHLTQARSNLARRWQDLSAIVYPQGKLAIIEDLESNYRALVLDVTEETVQSIKRIIEDATGTKWTRDIAVIDSRSLADRELFELATREAEAVAPGIWFLVRRENRQGWFEVEEPFWDKSPRLVGFYSFKGGVGRTTTMLGVAARCAQARESVALIDLDLDAPGLRSLFEGRADGVPAEYGIVDYLNDDGPKTLRDYYSTHQLGGPDGAEAYLFHAGALTPDYIDRLSKIDFDAGERRFDGLRALFEQIKAELNPTWLLIDSRAGLSESAGLLTSGALHILVLVATNSSQNIQGLSVILHQIGRRRYEKDLTQQDCLVVQSQVPGYPLELRQAAQDDFRSKTELIFEQHYLKPDPDASGRYWDITDLESRDAPNVTVPIRYDTRLVQYSDAQVPADYALEVDDFGILYNRIAARFEAAASGDDEALAVGQDDEH